jgi:serine/threonine protein phosphatase PrpC
MELNGDAFFIKKWGEHVLISVIDGLGHGQFAHRASHTAVNYLEKHYNQPFIDLFRGVGRACRSTRGIVMALARFDWARKIVTIGNVGNIEIRVFESREPLKIVIRRGILGTAAPVPSISQNPWDEKSVMVMYSDGIKTHWQWKEFSQYHNESATSLARRLLFSLARDTDDATLIVVKKKVQE